MNTYAQLLSSALNAIPWDFKIEYDNKTLTVEQCSKYDKLKKYTLTDLINISYLFLLKLNSYCLTKKCSIDLQHYQSRCCRKDLIKFMEKDLFFYGED